PNERRLRTHRHRSSTDMVPNRMRFYINPGTTMTKAANLLGLFLLLVSTAPSMAQPAAADSATDEAVRRQAAIIMLRQRLAEARVALDKADLLGASERYERAYELRSEERRVGKEWRSEGARDE